MVELAFDPTSPQGSLFADIRSEYLRSGGTEAALIGELNRGYSSSAYIQVHTNNPAKIEPGELFEMAYRHQRFHPYLAKYGYPLPIGMNDYDPKTKVDEELRGEIDRTVAQLVDETKRANLVPGTAAYVTKLSEKLFNWGMTRLASKQPCSRGQDDWEAMRDRCGVCVDKTAVMHYALGKAELKPEFVYVIKFEPNLANFNRFSNQNLRDQDERKYDSHVCVGVPVPGRGGLLHVDVAQRWFDADYRYGMVVSPRRFVMGYVHNQVADQLKGGLLREAAALADKCLAVDDENIGCYNFVGSSHESVGEPVG